MGVLIILPWIPLFWAEAPVRDRGFLGFWGGVSGSGGIWEEAGAWFIRIGGEEWVI